MENLVSGFRFCGIYPFNRDAQQSRSQSENLNPSSLAKHVPLYSPARPSLESPSTPKFSVDEVLEYQRRFEGSYNVPNTVMRHRHLCITQRPCSPDSSPAPLIYFHYPLIRLHLLLLRQKVTAGEESDFVVLKKVISMSKQL